MNLRILPAMLAMMLLAGGCSTTPSRIPGYLTGPEGSLLKNVHGQCWRTVDWRPLLAIEECDPAVVRERQAMQLATALSAVASPPVTRAGAAAESPVAPPAAPAPTTADLVTRPVVLNTDAAFHFGKDRLTRAGRDAVENLAAYIQLWRIEEVQVEVVGHTDRIGSGRDNLALSKRRAEAVREVLLASGVPADAVTARGVGSGQPVTLPEDCPDDLVRCDLISCLAPDRRVEVNLKGSRKAQAR